MDVDVIGSWRTIRAALPHMRKQGEGLIINISSVAGRFSFPFQTIYNSAKFAVEGLTEGLHYEVSDHLAWMWLWYNPVHFRLMFGGK